MWPKATGKEAIRDQEENRNASVTLKCWYLQARPGEEVTSCSLLPLGWENQDAAADQAKEYKSRIHFSQLLFMVTGVGVPFRFKIRELINATSSPTGNTSA